MLVSMQFYFKMWNTPTLVQATTLLHVQKKTDRFRLTNHKITVDHASSSNIIIVASQESSLHLFLRSWNQRIRILDHAINQWINLFIYGTIKLQKRERWESENFDGKLHLKKQIKNPLIQRHEHEHKHGFISWATTSSNFSGTEQSDSTLTPLFPHHQNPGG